MKVLIVAVRAVTPMLLADWGPVDVPGGLGLVLRCAIQKFVDIGGLEDLVYPLERGCPVVAFGREGQRDNEAAPCSCASAQV